jgi:hypothetical protein
VEGQAALPKVPIAASPVTCSASLTGRLQPIVALGILTIYHIFVATIAKSLPSSGRSGPSLNNSAKCSPGV